MARAIDGDELLGIERLLDTDVIRKVDLTNLLEAADDALVTAGVLADDNSKIVVSHDGSRCFVDKYNPRTEIYITKIPCDEQMQIGSAL